VIRAWTTPRKPGILADTDQNDLPPVLITAEDQLGRLRTLVDTYERMTFIRLVRWLHPHRQRLRQWLGRR
jgi:hypothetical protein